MPNKRGQSLARPWHREEIGKWTSDSRAGHAMPLAVNMERSASEKRAKPRLVVLAFAGQGVGSVAHNAPTFSKGSAQLLLQKAANCRWDPKKFDGEGDGRPLGIHPPPKTIRALSMGSQDQCGLEGGAYGCVGAPYLWYKAFRKTLTTLGFTACPFDGCLFSLVTPD